MTEVALEEHGRQLVYTITKDSAAVGYVVIDSMVEGRSCGGLRMLPDIDEAEIRHLAQKMTLKYGLLGLPQGGAKAGVRGNPEWSEEKRRDLLESFGRAISPLLRSHAYVPNQDMGTNDEDIRYMLRAVGTSIKRRELRGTDSGYYTALTIMAGLKQAARQLGLALSGASAAIEGFGRVGRPLAELLTESNVRVVAISTQRGAIFNPQGLDVKRLKEIASKERGRVVELYPNAKRTDRAALLELPVDLLCPCARHDSLNVGNASRVKARIISPGANNPVTPEAERVLHERGVLCMPDFVTNCGGVLGGTMEFASVNRRRIAAFIDHHIGSRMAWFLAEASRHGVVPSQIATRMAEHGFEQMSRESDHPTPLRRVFNFTLELYRRGCIPGPLVAPLSIPYFKRRLAACTGF